MASTIKVDPTQLNSTAGQVESAAGEYRQQYTTLFNQVASMQAAWQGIDNQAFTTRIEGFRPHFDVMYKLMGEYSTFLRTAAQTYQQAQQEVVSQAQRLAN